MEDLKTITTPSNFKAFSPDSKLWIYVAERLLSEVEVVYINGKLSDFCADWTSHGTPVKSSFRVIQNCFIHLSVDANIENASGCSIDSSMSLIKELQNKLGVSFTNRLSIPIEIENKITFYHFNDLNELIKKQEIPSNAVTFNNAISTLKELENWKQPIYNSWISNL